MGSTIWTVLGVLIVAVVLGRFIDSQLDRLHSKLDQLINLLTAINYKLDQRDAEQEWKPSKLE